MVDKYDSSCRELLEQYSEDVKTTTRFKHSPDNNCSLPDNVN